MAMNNAACNAATGYGVYGEQAPVLPLMKCVSLDRTLPLPTKDVGSPLAVASDDATTHRSTVLTEDCFETLDAYGPENALALVDRTGCKSALTDRLADMETVDTTMETTSLADTDFPADYFDLYANSEAACGNYFMPECGVRAQRPAEDGSCGDAMRPMIRLKSVVEPATPSEEYSRYAAAVQQSRVNRSPGTEPLETGYARQTRPVESTHNIEDFIRSSSQLYQPFDKMMPRMMPEVPPRSDWPPLTVYDLPVTTPPSSAWSGDQRFARPMSLTTRAPFFYGGDVPTYESDLYYPPTVSHKSLRMYNEYPVQSNYCVYVGSDQNAMQCGCNMMRPCGGKCHVSGCSAVTSEVEQSTEQWPVAGSSYLQSLVKNLDRVVGRYQSPTNCADPSKGMQRLQGKQWQQNNRVGPYGSYSQEPVAPRGRDFGKRTAPVAAEFNAQREENACPDYYVQTSYEDSPYDSGVLSGDHDAPVKQRKTNRGARAEGSGEFEAPSRNAYGRFVTARPASPASSPEAQTQYTTPKPAKKKTNVATTHSGEKVSGVWYDTNRHLWRVVYMKGNKRKTQGFSSIKLGYEEARRKAIEMRHEMVALRRTDKI